MDTVVLVANVTRACIMPTCYHVPCCRVTDDKDRLLLNTILERCYCPGTVDLGPSYSLSASGLYHTPPDGARDLTLSYIEGLPITPLPEAFGLHQNADITKDINDTELMLASLLGMSGGGGGGSGGCGSDAKGTEARVAALVEECLGKLPADFDCEEVQRR
jgi:dynein heavy chain, axonemal